MAEEKEIIEILREIRAAVNVLASERRDGLVKEITTTTPARRKMYRLFNGRLRIEEVAKKVGTSAEAVRLFAEECRRAGLVEYLAPKKGRGRFPKRVV